MTFINDLKAYNKFFIALLGAVVTTVVAFYGNNPYVQACVALLSVLGVYTVPNKGA